MRECLVGARLLLPEELPTLVGLGVEDDDVDGVEVPVAGHHATDAPVW